MTYNTYLTKQLKEKQTALFPIEMIKLTERTHQNISMFFFSREISVIQSNFEGSNLFGTMKICSRQRLFERRKITIGATPGGIMEIIVGYLFGVLYFKCMLCVLIRIAS